jgi:thiosulfate/3-mercaptopyruvate sulfurtransferase
LKSSFRKIYLIDFNFICVFDLWVMEKTMQKKSPLINPVDLAGLMKQGNIVLIDARTGPDAREKYNAEHLEGAQFVDLEKDLAQKSADPSDGGRHPLPAIKNFVELLGRLGIVKSTHVVVYDDKAGANAAARFWWLIKAAGHENIQVLDGGLKNAIEAGLPLTNIIPNIKTQPAYPAEKWILPTVNADAVAKAAADPNYLVIDVREAYRYRGESEPFDLIAGHIPGAVNIPYTGNLEADGNFLSADKLADIYKEAIGDHDTAQVIVHCGSGVTACHTLLAMEQAGIETPNLYVGSWSEWSRNDRPVAIGQ